MIHKNKKKDHWIMRYTKEEYIRLGRTLQTTIYLNLPDNAMLFINIAVNFNKRMYRVLYEIIQIDEGIDYFEDYETIINEIQEFNLYQQMIDYLNSIGIDINQLTAAKGLKKVF